MLESVRAYAAACLDAGSDAAVIRDRHAAHFAGPEPLRSDNPPAEFG